MNGLVFGNGILDWTSDKLLDLLCGGTRPRTIRHGDPYWNVRILPLRHALVPKPAPNEYTHEQHPRNLWVLHEEPGEIAGFFDSIPVALICHEFVCLRNLSNCVAIFQKLSAHGDHTLSRLDSLNCN